MDRREATATGWGRRKPVGSGSLPIPMFRAPARTSSTRLLLRLKPCGHGAAKGNSAGRPRRSSFEREVWHDGAPGVIATLGKQSMGRESLRSAFRGLRRLSEVVPRSISRPPWQPSTISPSTLLYGSRSWSP